jgi:hypothetical protein
MVLSEMEKDLCASPSVINRYIKINKSNSCNVTFTAVVLPTPVFVFTFKFMTGKLSRLLYKLKKQYVHHMSKHC